MELLILILILILMYFYLIILTIFQIYNIINDYISLNLLISLYNLNYHYYHYFYSCIISIIINYQFLYYSISLMNFMYLIYILNDFN